LPCVHVPASGILVSSHPHRSPDHNFQNHLGAGYTSPTKILIQQRIPRFWPTLIPW
jgi:hypothetical protein